MHGIRSILLLLWCDDFEPNYQKSNRGSVWVMTLTIEWPTSGVPSVEHVYPIAVGPTKSDHYDLLEVIWKDILSLKNDGIKEHDVRMYNGFTNKVDIVSAHIIAWTMDQPEGRSVNGLLLGGSTSLSRFGYSINLAQFITTIRPCETCYGLLVNSGGNKVWINSHCGNCCLLYTSPSPRD